MSTRQLRLLDQVESTQDVALELARQGAPHGTVVVAESQSEGRGRQGRIWADSHGQSLLLSLVVRPERSLSELPTLSLVAGIAVAEAIARGGVEARLKWPNDVVVDGRKLAGILAELHDEGSLVILGIGINVTDAGLGDVPTGSLPATSLAAEGGRVDRLALLRDVLESFDECFELWTRSGFAALVERYGALDALRGTLVEAEAADGAVRGLASGVEASGAIIVEGGAGRRAINSGEVRRIRPAASQRLDPPTV